MPSTVISSYAYDAQGATLDMTFLSGRRYRYYLVPARVAEELGEALSKGRYFNVRIRDRYPFEELAAEKEPEPPVTSRRKGSRQRP